VTVTQMDDYETRQYAECSCGSTSFRIMAHNPDGQEAIVDGFECEVCGMTTWLTEDDDAD